MKREHSIAAATCCALLVCSIASRAQKPGSSVAPKASSANKVQLTPHYSAGQIIRYQLESTTTTSAHQSGMVTDPQGANALTVTWNATVKMEVLSTGDGPAKNPDGSLRMRTTYEKSVASHSTDAYDPETEGIENQYHNLEGKSFELMIDPTGRVTSVAGFDESSGQGAGATALRAWIGQIAATSGAPRDGISVGQTWQSEQPVPSSPLAGLSWRSRSTYLRDEPCNAVKPAGDSNAFADETCAVIMTKVALVGSRGAGHDATPPNYRKNNLRTSGDWTGEGESLSYVSLRSGRLVSVTQSSSEQMNFTVSSVQVGSNLHYDGAVKTRTQLSLVPESASDK